MKRPGYQEIGSFLESYLVRPGLPESERRRSVLLAGYLLVLTPLVCGLAIKALLVGETEKVWVTAFFLPILLLQLAWLRFGRRPMILFRILLLISMTSIGRTAILGEQENLVFLWLYLLPPLTFFLLGQKEGAWWIGTSFLSASILLASPLLEKYDAELRISFVFTYLILALLSYGLEAAREGHLEHLRNEKEALAEALVQVQTLQGLLPICASCKRVRDDSGYWGQIESYLESYPEVELKHALCTRCENDERTQDEGARGTEADLEPERGDDSRASLGRKARRSTEAAGHASRWMSRFGTGTALAVLASFMAVGAFDGFAFLWLYFFPLLGFYVFGRREGMAWALTALATGLVFLVGSFGFHDEPERAVLFSITYVLVTTISFALESSRVHARERVETETAALQKALARVRTLRGLLPICPACKRVRDGEGFWGQIEDYLATHVDTSFSHGLCPPCADEFLADLDNLEEAEVETTTR